MAYHNPEELRLYFRDEHWNRYEVRFYPQGTNVKIYDGTWHHIAHGYDPSASLLEDRMIYYVDGIRQTVQVLLMGIPYDSSDFNEPMTLGAFNRRGSISYYLNGCLDEVAFYTRPLTAEEVTSHYQAATVVTITVDVDIKPGSEPNCFNQNDRGVIPVAILGRDDFDVSMIKVDTLSLQGLAVKMTGKSNKYLAHIEDVNGDGSLDLVVQFQDSDDWVYSGNGTATLTGKLLDGTPIQGSDSVCIVP